MKKMMIMTAVMLSVFTGASWSAVELSGVIRNDAAVLKTTNQFQFGDILENRLVFSRKTDDWRFYTDLRVFLYSGYVQPQVVLNTNMLPVAFAVALPRMFIRWNTSVGSFTAGKTYINFGNFGLFNPFEVSKNINFSDLAYDKDGLIAFMWEFPFGELSGGKLYVSPSTGITNSAFGGSLNVNLFQFDVGAVANRKDLNKNTAGLYFKGDIELGINGSWACHFDDRLTNVYSEASAGIDYSFLDGKLFTGLTFYYNERGAVNTNDYTNVSVTNDVYLKAKYYLYGTASYQHDEFLGFQMNVFFNLTDYSWLLSPSVSYVLADGLTGTFLFMAIFGDNSQEFSRRTYGEYAFLLRLEAKL